VESSRDARRFSGVNRNRSVFYRRQAFREFVDDDECGAA